MAVLIILALIFGMIFFYIMWMTGNFLLGIIGLGLYLTGFAILDFTLRMKRRTIRNLKGKNIALRKKIGIKEKKKIGSRGRRSKGHVSSKRK